MIRVIERRMLSICVRVYIYIYIYIYRYKVWMLYYDCNGVRYIGKVEGASSYRKDRLYYKIIILR